MKVTYTVRYSDNCHRTAEVELDSHDYNGLLEDMDRAVELHKLRALKRKVDTENLKKELESMPPANIELAPDEPVHEIMKWISDGTDGRMAGTDYYVCNRCPMDTMHTAEHCNEFYPHKNIFEYDGAFRCHSCHSTWGALPGKPQMPNLCTTNDAFHL